MVVGERGFFGWFIWPFTDYTVTHCAICWNSPSSDFITSYVSGIFGISRISKNVKLGTQSAGNQQPHLVVHKSSLVGTSETTRATQFSPKFCQWLAGLIDGDGSLLVSKAGYTSCEITMSSADLVCLRYLQDKLGGSIKPRSGVNALRWRLHNKTGMITLIDCINGHIRHSARLVQLHRVCQILNVSPLTPISLMNRTNAWFSGFFDADGTVTLNLSGKYPQVTISVTNKVNADVQFYKETFGGAIYFDSSQNGYYKWTVQSRADIHMMLDYFKTCPAHSFKLRRLHLITQFFKLYDLHAFKPDSIYHSSWQQFMEKWNAKI
jgi:hypothetical protein